MKPLTLDQQIQLARVFGWISVAIEGAASKREQHESVLRAAATLCPILRLDGVRPNDNLWELAGWPEGGFTGPEDELDFLNTIHDLAVPLRKEP